MDNLFGGKKSKRSINPTICPVCGIKPIALNKATGEYFKCCSRSCARNARKTAVSRTGSQAVSPGLCELCGQNPKFVDATKVHRYCSKKCARLATSSSSTSPTTPSTAGTGISNTSWAIPPVPICRTPGCALPAFVHPNGVTDKYCNGTHKHWGEHGCISCRAAPMDGQSIMCQLCHNNAIYAAPIIIEVPEDHDSYASVATQFQKSWRHRTPCPPVRAIYKIFNTEASVRQYELYRDSVEARGNFVAMGRSPGNENRRWHGTRRRCNIGDTGITNFCADQRCALCNIIRSSFNLRYFGRATGWGRFGAGIYTSSTSSKSHSYSRNIGITSEWKALLLNKVVVGKGLKLTKDSPSLTQPPQGYDSVLAEVVPGGVLNYDELVVYHNDAVRPSYLVMYQTPPQSCIVM